MIIQLQRVSIPRKKLAERKKSWWGNDIGGNLRMKLRSGIDTISVEHFEKRKGYHFHQMDSWVETLYYVKNG